MLTRLIVTIISASAACAPVAAEDSGFYVGLGLGGARNEIDGLRFDGPVAKIFAGYAVNDYFAVEAAYIDPRPADDTIRSVQVELDPKSTVVSAMASLPLHERWSVFGKAGWSFDDVRQTVQIAGVRASRTVSADEFAWGLGTAVRLGEHVSLRLEYEAVDVAEGTFNTAMVGGVVRF